MKYFQPKMTLSSSLHDDNSGNNLSDEELMRKHLDEYRKCDKLGRLFSPISGSQEAPGKQTKTTI